MSAPAQQQTKVKNYLLDTLQALLVAGLIWSVLQYNTFIALTLALLVGVWIIDAYVKKSLNFSNETIFADLSFSALMLVISRIIDVVRTSLFQASTERIIQFALLALILFIIWYANIAMCRGITDRLTQANVILTVKTLKIEQRPAIWIFSFILSAISTFLALYAQSLPIQ